MKRPFIRSKLFVPAVRPELFEKALASQADAVSFDLEDSVPESHKEEARALLAAFLRSQAALRSNKTVIVRVNAVGGPHFEADLLAVAAPIVALFNLPKVHSAEEVHRAADVLARIEETYAIECPIGLLINIETPSGLRNAAAIASSHPRVAALQLGLGDLFGSLGIDRRDMANVHATMYALRMAAAEAGVAAYDGAFPGIADESAFCAEAQMAHRLGFAGKSCIHPNQIEWANRVFAPSSAELAAALRVLDACDHASAAGRGAFVVDGQMIDQPFVERARAVVASASL